MKTKYLLSSAVLVCLLAFGVTWVAAHDADPNFFACMNKSSGTIRMVAAETDCKIYEVKITWYSAIGVDDKLAVLEQRMSNLETENEVLRNQVQSLEGLVAELQTGLNAEIERTESLESLLVHFSRDGNDIMINGANLHIVNGTGSTYFSPNGLGNVIIGYNENREDDPNVRSGSHMLVVGKENNYTSSGGIVAGQHNSTDGFSASIVGGLNNTASEDFSTVCGGQWNTASADFSSVGGGLGNTASGSFSTVSGGQYTTCSDWYSWCAGGLHWPP